MEESGSALTEEEESREVACKGNFGEFTNLREYFLDLQCSKCLQSPRNHALSQNRRLVRHFDSIKTQDTHDTRGYSTRSPQSTSTPCKSLQGPVNDALGNQDHGNLQERPTETAQGRRGRSSLREGRHKVSNHSFTL